MLENFKYHVRALWVKWEQLVESIPEHTFSPQPAPIELSVLDKPSDEDVNKFQETISRRKEFHVETSKTIRRVLYTLVATCLFCAVTLFGTPDVHLLTPDSTVKLPILNYEMSFAGFLVVGPIVLIGLTTYVHIFVGQHRIATVPREDRFAMLSNFDGWTPRLVIVLLLYWMVPITMAEFAWKAKPRPGGIAIYFVACNVVVVLSYLQYRRCSKDFRARGIAILLSALVLYFSYTTSRILNRHLSLFKADLSEQDLRGVNLESAFLSEANLENAFLLGANLQRANLINANLQGANLVNANLQGAILITANLKATNLNAASFKGADLSGANLQGANLLSANLQEADLSEANFKDSYLVGAFFQSSILIDTEFQGAKLTAANFSGVDLGGANFYKANLVNTNFQDAILTDPYFDGANLSGARLKGADGLNQHDLDVACGSEKTTLPDGLTIEYCP